MWLMSAALKLNLESKQLSRKSPLGEKRPRLRLVWENPKLTADSHKEKSEVKPDSSYGRVLYNYFRYYDPETGRYITADPIGQLAGPNLYAYVGGNPLKYFDPFGLLNWLEKKFVTDKQISNTKDLVNNTRIQLPSATVSEVLVLKKTSWGVRKPRDFLGR